MESSSSVQMCASGGAVFFIVYTTVLILLLASFWRIFTKAGQPGWAVLIPLYNLYIMLKVAGKPGWWILLMFLPLINLVIMILVYLALAERFGKGGAFAIGMIVLPIVFFPILAFGEATYTPTGMPLAPPL